VLDFSGDEDTLGKPVGSDLRQGTITLPVILLAQDLPTGSQLWADPFGADVDKVVRAVQESDVLDRSRERAREYSHAARVALSIFPESKAKEALEQLSENVISRTS
jgi:geranylgeranyl pyrophosphate synthase